MRHEAIGQAVSVEASLTAYPAAPLIGIGIGVAIGKRKAWKA